MRICIQVGVSDLEFRIFWSENHDCWFLWLAGLVFVGCGRAEFCVFFSALFGMSRWRCFVCLACCWPCAVRLRPVPSFLCSFWVAGGVW